MMSTTPAPIQDFMSTHATPDTDSLQLSSGEFHALQEYVRYALELLSDMICLSEHHARCFNHCRKGNEPSPQDFEILEEQALVIMEKGEFAFSLLDEIDQALDERYADQFDRSLDELLRPGIRQASRRVARHSETNKH